MTLSPNEREIGAKARYAARFEQSRNRVRELSGHALLSPTEVAAMLCITTKHIRVLEDAGEFPARVQLGRNKKGWRLKDIEEYIDARQKRHRICEDNRRGRWAAADERGADHG